MNQTFLRAVLPGAVFCTLAGVIAAPAFHIVGKIALGGPSGWDYLAVDDAARRLYVSHDTQVDVIDLKREKPAGVISGLAGVHGFALAPELGRGFVASGKTNTVRIFDLKTLNTLGEVKTEANPNALVYEPLEKRVFSFNKAASSATVFDAKTGEVVATIPLEGRLEFAVTDGKGQIYFNVEDKSMMMRLDTKSMQVKEKWPLAPCADPVGLAFDRKNRRLFAGCRNQVMVVVDADSGRVVADLPIGKGIDAMAYDAQRSLVFSSNGEGTLTVIQQQGSDQYRVRENAATQVGARTMALDPSSHRIYLSVVQYSEGSAPAPGQSSQRRSAIPGSFGLLVAEQ